MATLPPFSLSEGQAFSIPPNYDVLIVILLTLVALRSIPLPNELKVRLRTRKYDQS